MKITLSRSAQGKFGIRVDEDLKCYMAARAALGLTSEDYNGIFTTVEDRNDDKDGDTDGLTMHYGKHSKRFVWPPIVPAEDSLEYIEDLIRQRYAEVDEWVKSFADESRTFEI